MVRDQFMHRYDVSRARAESKEIARAALEEALLEREQEADDLINVYDIDYNPIQDVLDQAWLDEDMDDWGCEWERLERKEPEINKLGDELWKDYEIERDYGLEYGTSNPTGERWWPYNPSRTSTV